MIYQATQESGPRRLVFRKPDGEDFVSYLKSPGPGLAGKAAVPDTWVLELDEAWDGEIYPEEENPM